MTAAAALDALYKIARVVVWVEDPLTRDYLRAAWGSPPDVGFLVAGTNDAIPRLVTAARQSGIRHVFGVVDRDTGFSNRDKWAARGRDVFYWPRHEVENYLLDADALAGCALNSRKRTPPEVQAQIESLAARQPAWLACRSAIRAIRQEVVALCPSVPKIADVPDAAAAVTSIRACGWLDAACAAATRWLSGSELEQFVETETAHFRASLADGTWIDHVSGKEVFRQVRAFVYEPGRTGGNHDNDVAKAVAEWQSANDRLPADVAALLAALRLQVS